MKSQVEKALNAFRFVLAINCIDDVYKEKKGKLVFEDKMILPSIYHLRLLAFTNSWRNAENKRMLVVAFNKLCDFETFPAINLLHKNQIISVANFSMNDFSVNLDQLSAKEWMMWFHRMELVSRLGIVSEIPAFCEQIDKLKQILKQNNGIFPLKLSHYYFHKWTPYLGLALENDWKRKGARACDLTFRSLLILKHSLFPLSMQ